MTHFHGEKISTRIELLRGDNRGESGRQTEEPTLLTGLAGLTLHSGHASTGPRWRKRLRRGEKDYAISRTLQARVENVVVMSLFSNRRLLELRPSGRKLLFAPVPPSPGCRATVLGPDNLCKQVFIKEQSLG